MPKAKSKSTKKTNSVFNSIRKQFANPNYGLKTFRSDVAKLRKAGLVSKRKKATFQTPTRYMLGQIKKFADVIQGKAKTISVPKSEKAAYQQQGYRVKANKVVVPTPHGQKVRRTKPKAGVPTYRSYQESPSGERMDEHYIASFETLEKSILEKINAAPNLRKGQYYAFKFYGNNSWDFFPNKEALAKYFLAYSSVQNAIVAGNTEHMSQIYQNFAIVTLSKKKLDQWDEEHKQQAEVRNVARKERNRERYQRWLERRYQGMSELEIRYAKERARRDPEIEAAKKRAQRARIKAQSPETYQRTLERNRVRAAKSRAKRKATK